MVAEIISVGTELLMGQVLNTDAQFIAKKLAEFGINNYYQVTVGDNRQRLLQTINTALSRSDIVILSGGLGPTGDDLTKETAAEALGLDMECNKAALEHIKERFKRLNREMTENNLKQAMFPKGSIILPNPNGTAPGCIMESSNKAIVLLPGPPNELIPMFTDRVVPYLEKKHDFILYSRVLRVFGMGEAALEYALRDMIQAQTNPTIATYALTGESTVRLTARCKTYDEGRTLVEPVIDAIIGRIGDVVYSTNDEPLAQVCANALAASKLTLSVAESCTGGMLSSALVDIPGSSAWFMGGVTAYSNAIKTKLLNVPESMLLQHGAVSSETAKQMAEGIRQSFNTDMALSTTGIAGPDGGTEAKPVGLVYIALASEQGTFVEELRLTGNRQRIRHIATLNALNLLRKHLNK